jgi:hypothetical protein
MTGRTFLIQSLCAVAALFAWSGASAAPLKDPATALGLVPHKALYDVSLVSAKNGSQIVNIHGKMFFEWKPSCEGWITDHRFILSYDYADSPPMAISSDFSTFEKFDGKSMNFSSRRKKDGEVYEDIRGKAALDKPGGGGQAVYSIPEGLTFDLGPEIMFPTTQTSALLKRARQGTGLYKTVIFDGSDEEGPVEVNSFMENGSKRARTSCANARRDSRLPRLRSP